MVREPVLAVLQHRDQRGNYYHRPLLDLALHSWFVQNNLSFLGHQHGTAEHYFMLALSFSSIPLFLIIFSLIPQHLAELLFRLMRITRLWASTSVSGACAVDLKSTQRGH